MPKSGCAASSSWRLSLVSYTPEAEVLHIPEACLFFLVNMPERERESNAKGGPAVGNHSLVLEIQCNMSKECTNCRKSQMIPHTPFNRLVNKQCSVACLNSLWAVHKRPLMCNAVGWVFKPQQYAFGVAPSIATPPPPPTPLPPPQCMYT